MSVFLRNFFLLLTLTLISCNKNVKHPIDEEVISSCDVPQEPTGVDCQNGFPILIY
ncbi:MAG: hypothetical protein ACPGTO_04580 [Polaribacter sp.]